MIEVQDTVGWIEDKGSGKADRQKCLGFGNGMGWIEKKGLQGHDTRSEKYAQFDTIHFAFDMSSYLCENELKFITN